MRKISLYLFAMLAVVTLATSCKKVKPEPAPGPGPQLPENVIPEAYVGKWIMGNVNPAHFADYDGSRQDDMVNTIAYYFKKDGTAEQFIYVYEEDKDKQTLNLRKGTVVFDEATSTLKFKPTQGRYRIFENGEKFEGAISAAGLNPQYAPGYRNCSIEEEDNVSYLVGTNDYDENVGFAKVNW